MSHFVRPRVDISFISIELFRLLNCSGNKLTSLKHSPTICGLGFYCEYNNLKNLEHCPKNIKGYFDCSRNKINSLKYIPLSVGQSFYCYNNPQLGDIQNITDFNEILKIQSTIKFKDELDNELLNNNLNQKSKNKI